MNIKDRNDFITAFDSLKKYLDDISFKLIAYEQKGASTHIYKYKKDTYIVEFMYGPPDYEIYMRIRIGEYILDTLALTKIKEIQEWLNKNKRKYVGKNLREEILWFIKLLQFSLPIIEKINIDILDKKLKQASLQEYDYYKKQADKERLLREADLAWENKNYIYFINIINKLKTFALPKSYSLKYEIAKKRIAKKDPL